MPINNPVQTVNTPTGIKGIAQSGAFGMLIDNTKNFQSDNLVGSTIVITVDGVEYRREIVDVFEDQIIFLPLPLGDVASVLIEGSGDGDNTGEITISVKEFGTPGNEYSFLLAAGTGLDAMETIDFTNGLLTITSGTDGTGAALPMFAGNIQNLINNTAGVSDIFSAPLDFMPGSIETFAEPVPFVGGTDGVSVVEGTEYFIFNDVNDVVVKGPLPAGSNNIGAVGIDQVTDHANEVVLKGTSSNTGEEVLLTAIIDGDGKAALRTVDAAPWLLAKDSAGNVTQILTNGDGVVVVNPQRPTAITLYNITCTNANTEYSTPLPIDCKRFRLSIRDGLPTANYRVAYVTGKVATPTAPYLKFLGDYIYDVDQFDVYQPYIYFASSLAGSVVQIEAWS